jgi:hypothetical protein
MTKHTRMQFEQLIGCSKKENKMGCGGFVSRIGVIITTEM